MRQKKKEAKKRTDKKELMYKNVKNESFLVCPLLFFLLLLSSVSLLNQKKTIFVESACVLLFPCVSSHW